MVVAPDTMGVMTATQAPARPCQPCIDAGLPSVPATPAHRLLDCKGANPTSFVVGKTYDGRWISDADSIFTFRVAARTAKFVTIVDLRDRHAVPKRVGVRVSYGVEKCSPYGVYSMSPVLSADRAVTA